MTIRELPHDAQPQRRTSEEQQDTPGEQRDPDEQRVIAAWFELIDSAGGGGMVRIRGDRQDQDYQPTISSTMMMARCFA
jgi:hypothetical protein